jgi:hypothetical protein
VKPDTTRIAIKTQSPAKALLSNTLPLSTTEITPAGHGTPKPDGSRESPYHPNHTADPDPNRRWDSQYPSLWVAAGGGGTFLDLWTPSTFAQAGMLVYDTETVLVLAGRTEYTSIHSSHLPGRCLE